MSNYPWPLLEFQHLFPFNRRSWPVAALDNVLKIAAGVKALTYRDFSKARRHMQPPRNQTSLF